jgi:DNA-3-methyladenine glycosylase II
MMDHYTTTLTSPAPYDFDLTASYATYFQKRHAADSYIDGVFSRPLEIGDSLCLIKISSLGSIESPELRLVVKGTDLDDRIISEAKRQATRLLGIDQDPKPFYRMASEETFLGPLVQRLKGLHIPQAGSVWEALVLAILGQQISSHVARLLRRSLVDNYGFPLTDNGSVHHAFPRPDVIAEIGVRGLQAIKISRNKATYIVDIAGRIASGSLELENLQALSDKEIIDFLTAIRGVGPWTANWLLIRAFGRPDGFPVEDLALRRTLNDLLIRGTTPLTPAHALQVSKRWSPFRSYVTTYLFAALRSGLLSQ